MKIILPDVVQTVIRRLNQNGFEAYVVGGCVRDALLNKQPDDWDVCTSASPDEVLHSFQDVKTVPTGIQHGTITVIIEKQPIEVTTYRKDGSYSDHRHPDAVEFSSSLKEDLSRRDFTINAMAFHPDDGVVDIFEGQKDLANRTVRCVGRPAQRFQEDALRILRGIRFASVLDFAIEQQTKTAILENYSLLEYVAPERIRVEVDKLLCGERPGCMMYEFSAVFERILPNWSWQPEITETINKLPPILPVRLAALYLNSPDVSLAMRSLRYSVAMIRHVEQLLHWLKMATPITKPRLRRMFGALGREQTQEVLLLLESRGADISDTLCYLQQIQQQNLCCSIKDLTVDGNDLVLAGIAPGREIGEALEMLLDAVILDKVINEQDALLMYIKEVIKKS